MKWAKICISVWLLAILLGRWADGRIVGTIEGPDLEYLTIGDEVYQVDPSAPCRSADRENYIGNAVTGELTAQVYTVEGREDYLYCLWDWEGEAYKKIESADISRP